MRSSLSVVMMVVMWSHSTLAIQNFRVANAFKNAAIVPEIIPVAPRDILEVYYPRSTVCLGNDIPNTDTALRPLIEYNAHPSTNYTLIMIDPDLPTAPAPAYRSTLYGLVVNIPGEYLKPRDPNSEYFVGGRTIARYFPVILYTGSGYRRFIFLMYAQTRTLDVTDRNLLHYGIDRFSFSLSDFVKKYDMGELVAGNYFVSSSESSERDCKASY